MSGERRGSPSPRRGRADEDSYRADGVWQGPFIAAGGGAAAPGGREFRALLLVSGVLHLLVFGLVMANPRGATLLPPRVISVDLIGLPAPTPPAPAAPAAPTPAPPAPPPVEIPKPPEPVAPPPPAPPKPKEVVLPKNPTQRAPKPKPARREREIFREPEVKKEQSLEELMAQMRQQSGATAAAKPPPAAPPAPAPETASAPGSGQGARLSPEERAWHRRVRERMKGIWVVPPGFRTQPLRTLVEVNLDASGRVLGEPRILIKSGNPWYDEGVLRGLSKADPLPPPPEAGRWKIEFRPEDSF